VTCVFQLTVGFCYQFGGPVEFVQLAVDADVGCALLPVQPVQRMFRHRTESGRPHGVRQIELFAEKIIPQSNADRSAMLRGNDVRR